MMINARILPAKIELPPDGYAQFIPAGEKETLRVFPPQNFFVKGGGSYASAFDGTQADAAIRAVITGAVLPPGGTEEQVLVKASGADYRLKWKTEEERGR